MKTMLERVDALDNLIRQLRKMESNMYNGQFIDAWREGNRLIASLIRDKKQLTELQESISGNLPRRSLLQRSRQTQ